MFWFSYYLLLFNLLDRVENSGSIIRRCVHWDTRTLNANDHFIMISWVIFIDSNVISFNMLYHFFLKNPLQIEKKLNAKFNLFRIDPI